MFFDSWEGLGRVIVVGTLAYTALVIFLRISGKRTLSKMNAFDLIVTVAIGSTLATILLSEDVALAEGLLALLLLIALQYTVAWLSVRFPAIQQLVKSEPTLLFHRGEMLPGALRSQRVTPEEVRAAVRTRGIGHMGEVEAVILETDGSFSILPATDQPATAALGEVENYPPPPSTGTST